MNKKRRQLDKWINSACKYVATGDSSFLRTAKSKCTDPSILAFLESDNLTQGRQVLPNEYQPFLELLSHDNRKDEAAMIEILARRFVALATREIATYPEEERRFIFNTCEELAMVSSSHGFVDCEALFAGMLGIANAQLGKFQDAENLIQHSLSLLRALASNEPTVFQIILVRALKNHAKFCREARRLNDALGLASEAVELCRQLAIDNPDNLEWDLSLCLIEHGNILVRMNRLAEARKEFLQTLEIQSRRVDRDPKRFLPDLAGTHNNLALCLFKERQYSEARSHFEKCLKLRRKLIETEPERHTADLATTLNNLGLLLSDLREHRNAIERLEEAVDIRRRLAEDQPAAFQAEYAGAINNLGNAFLHSGRLNDAYEQYTQALSIRQQLVKADPDRHEPDLVQTLGNLAGLYREASHLDEASQRYREMIIRLRHLDSTKGSVYRHKLAEALEDYATTLYLSRRYDEAREAYDESIAYLRKLASKKAEIYAPRLAGALNDLAHMMEERGDMTTAVSLAQEAVELAESAREEIYLAKGDVLTAYRLLLEDKISNGTADEVFRSLVALREGGISVTNVCMDNDLSKFCYALKEAEARCGRKIQIIVAQRMAQGRPFLGVLQSDEKTPFTYVRCEEVVQPIVELFDAVQSGLVDEQGEFPSMELLERLGVAVWEALPNFIQTALRPDSNHEVIISGDDYLNDFPWEAIRFGNQDDDWLGLHLHLTRLSGLAGWRWQLLRRIPFGCGKQSASIICPWNAPDYEKLNFAKIEGERVSKRLKSLNYEILPDGHPLMGNQASKSQVISLFRDAPSLIHICGHGKRNGEECLVVWSEDSTRQYAALIGTTDINALKIRNNGSLVVMNTCWTGRTREFGGRREDLVTAFLDWGATAVIASPLPMIDPMAGHLGELLYDKSYQDKRGFGFSFAKIRALVERKFRGNEWWSAWCMMHFHGNFLARLPHVDHSPAKRSQKSVDVTEDLLDILDISPEELEVIQERIK